MSRLTWIPKPIASLLLATASGSVTMLAFAPYHIALLAILAPALLIILWHKASPQYAFWLGFAYGLGFFTTSVWWVIVSLHEFGHISSFLACLIALLFFGYLALFPGLTGYIYQRITHNSAWLQIIVVPSIWVLLEWLRGTLFTGFPWMILGYSQTNSWLKGYAPLVGSYGLSFICILLASGLAYTVTYQRHWLKAGVGIASIFIGGYCLNLITWTTPTQKTLTVSLVQGNIAQSEKWDQAKFFNTLQRYQTLIQSELGRDLVILPESALPVPDWFIQDYLNNLNQLAKQYGSDVVIGVPTQTQTMRQNDTFFNAIHVLGLDDGHYYKRHLVPFGEYLSFLKPLQFILNYFHIPMTSFIPGPTFVPPFQLKKVRITPLICYEIAYSQLVYDNLPAAEAILVVNDDSWYGDSAAVNQHLQIARMRALETRRNILFASNTGLTAIIQPNGNIQSQIPANQVAVLRDTITGHTGSTPISRVGDGFVLIICAIIVLISYWRRLLMVTAGAI